MLSRRKLLLLRVTGRMASSSPITGNISNRVTGSSNSSRAMDRNSSRRMGRMLRHRRRNTASRNMVNLNTGKRRHLDMDRLRLQGTDRHRPRRSTGNLLMDRISIRTHRLRRHRLITLRTGQ